MYKKHIRLEPLKKYPTNDHLLMSLETAQKTRGCTVELPWRLEGAEMGYSLTVRVELGGQSPIWALYEQGANSKILWSQTFTDMELLNDVILFTAPPPKLNKSLVSILNEGLPSSVLGDSPNIQANPNYPNQPGYPQVNSNYPSQQGYPPANQNYSNQQGYPQPNPNQPYPNQGYPQNTFNPNFPVIEDNTLNSANNSLGSLSPAKSLNLIQSDLKHLDSNVDNSAYNNTSIIDKNLIKKRPNLLLGTFLVEAKLVPEPTIDAALQLQDMIKAKTLTKAQAAIALRRTHERGGNVDNHIPEDLSPKILSGGDTKIQGPPLGQLLVDARILPASILKSALALQEVVRTGSINIDDALKTITLEHKKLIALNQEAKKQNETDPEIVSDAVQLLTNAGLLNKDDLEKAKLKYANNGGKLSSILIQDKFIDSLLLQIAITASEYLKKNALKIEQAIIVLHYCQRSRVGFKDAISELGFDLN